MVVFTDRVLESGNFYFVRSLVANVRIDVDAKKSSMIPGKQKSYKSPRFAGRLARNIGQSPFSKQVLLVPTCEADQHLQGM